nr:hypothetical protein [Tanacetum cinerariifolium]
NTSEPSNASTNVVNAPREPYVVKQDNGSFVDKISFDLNRALNSPNKIHCFHCKDVLRDGEACKRCTCEKCGSGLGKGHCYICGHNQNSLNDSPSISETSSQSPPNIDHCCYECGDALDGIFLLTMHFIFVVKIAGDLMKPFSVNQRMKIIAMSKILAIILILMVLTIKQEDKRIEEEQAVSARYWKIPACCDDDDDYDSAMTPVLSTEEPIDSLSMGDEHLDTIPATKSDEIMKIDKTDYDHEEDIRLTKRLLYDNSSPHPPEEFVFENYNADIESFFPSPIPNEDNDSFMEEIDLFLTSNDPMPPSIEDDDDDSERDILILEKLPSNYSLSLHVNESFHLDIPLFSSPPAKPPDEYDSFIFDLTHEEFIDELAHIISPPEYDCFYFRNLPDLGELMSVLDSGIRENLSTTSVNLPIENDYSPLLVYVVWIFVAYLTYPVIPPYLHSFGNEDTNFDPGITINHFYSSKPGSSHRHGAFKKFNTHLIPEI